MKAPTHDQLTHAAQLLATAEPEVSALLTDLANIASVADGAPDVAYQPELAHMLATMARIGGLSDADLQAAYQLMDEQAEQAMKDHAK